MTFKVKKTHGKNKRIQLLVNQNHDLENMHQNFPKRPSQKMFNNKTTICFIKYQPTFRETYNNEFYIILFVYYSRFVWCKDRG